jgi:hypothetical protein
MNRKYCDDIIARGNKTASAGMISFPGMTSHYT